MSFPRGFRFRLFTAMASVAVVAAALGWYVAERRERVAALSAELHVREDRVRWADAMRRHGYLGKTRLATERTRLKQAQSELKSLEGSVNPP